MYDYVVADSLKGPLYEYVLSSCDDCELAAHSFDCRAFLRGRAFMDRIMAA